MRVLSNSLSRWRVALSTRPFFRGVAVLAGSALIAHVCAICLMPVLTRVYSPKDFGILSAYLALLGVVTPVSALRLEMAIPLPKEDAVAWHMVKVCCKVVACSAVIAGFVVLGFVIFSDRPGMFSISRSFLWFVPFGIVGDGTYQVFSYWAIRRQAFRVIGQAQICNGAFSGFGQLGLAVLSFNSFGLVLGAIMGRLMAVTWLVGGATRGFREVLTGQSTLSTLCRYRRFPLLTGPASLLNAAGDSIPRLLITTWFGPALLGFFALGTQALFVPSTFICGAVSKVYYAEAACLRRENPGGLRELYLATARRLVVIAVFPAIIVLFLSPAVIVFLFGSQWRVAGVVAQLLAPAFVLQFTIVPITNFSVIERNDLALIWNAIWFVGLVGGMQVAHRLGFDFLETVGLYSVVLTCAYAIMFLMYLGALRRLSAVRKPGVHQG